MSQATTVKEVLIAAKWILEHTDWHQYTMYRYPKKCHRTPAGIAIPNSFCALGAIDITEAPQAVKAAAMDTLHGMVGPVASWNDMQSRTKEHVIELFDEAIGRQSKS